MPLSIYIFLALVNLVIFVKNWSYINFINPYVSFYLGFFIFVVFGGFYDGLGHLYAIDKQIKIDVLISFYLILFAGLMFKLLLKSLNKNTYNFAFKPLINQVNAVTTSRALRNYMLFVFIVGVLFSLVAFSLMSVIPVLSNNVHYYRIHELSGKGFLYHPSRLLIFFSTGFFSFLYFQTKEISKIFIILLITVGFVVLWGYAIRAEPLKIVVYFLLIYLLRKRTSVFSFFKTIIIFVFFFFFNGVLQYIRHYSFIKTVDADFNTLLVFGWSNIGHRFWVQLENLQFIYRNINEGELMGATYLNDLLAPLPGSSITGGVLLKNYIGLKFIGGGITPTILGEGYANIGKIPIFIFIFIFSFALLLLYSWMYEIILKNKDNPIIFMIIPGFLIFGFNCYGFSTATLVAKITMDLLPLVLLYSTIFLCYYFFIRKRANEKNPIFSTK